MKTSVVLFREMGNFSVAQRTSDGMFNATALLKQWNEYAGQQKVIGHFFENSSTKEFISELMLENSRNRNSDVGSLSDIYVKQKGGNERGSTWMSPLLFIDFAMWLNPAFKVKVLQFVYDELIKERNDAGDAYRDLCAAIIKVTTPEKLTDSITKIAQALNHVCFGHHEKDIRNYQSEASIHELVLLERELSLLINVGFLKSMDESLDYLRKKWNDKYSKNIAG